MMKFYIYAIYFPTSNKYYVGQTQDMKRRMSQHLENKSFVGKALRKYDDWVIEILHTVKDKDAVNLLEIEEIRHYNCVVPDGYNLTRGGEGGDTFTNSLNKKEKREKMKGKGKLGTSIAMKGNQNAKGNRWKWSKEYRQNKSKEMQGNQYAKGCKHSAQSKIKRLKTRIANLEKEI